MGVERTMDVQFDGRRKAPNPAATSLEPLRIRVAEHHQALALSRDLAEIGTVEVIGGTGVWEVCVHGSKSDGAVVKALDAVHRILTGAPLTSAEILLDGRHYQMQGE
jgi:hypothetical protein